MKDKERGTEKQGASLGDILGTERVSQIYSAFGLRSHWQSKSNDQKPQSKKQENYQTSKLNSLPGGKKAGGSGLLPTV